MISYIVAVSFIGGGNRRTQRKQPIFELYRGGQFYWWSTRRKPTICRKSL